MTDAIDPFKTNEGNPLETLVGEGKKFKDVESLAAGKIAADAHIELLQAELATARAAAADGKSVAELLAALKTQENEPPLGQPNGNGLGTPNSLKEEDVAQIALKTLEKTEKERTAKANLNAAVAKMNEVWGADTSKEFSKVAQSLGLSVEYLQAVAQQSPSAFFAMTGLNKDRSTPSGTTVPTSTVKFGNDAITGKRDAAFYRELRKNNLALYKETKTQIQMQRDALAQGEAFFN